MYVIHRIYSRVPNLDLGNWRSFLQEKKRAKYIDGMNKCSKAFWTRKIPHLSGCNSTTFYPIKTAHIVDGTKSRKTETIGAEGERDVVSSFVDFSSHIDTGNNTLTHYILDHILVSRSI